jgi:hypothetical protein
MLVSAREMNVPKYQIKNLIMQDINCRGEQKSSIEYCTEPKKEKVVDVT